MSRGLVIGIDIGTTNWKAAAFRPDGTPVDSRKCATAIHFMENGCGYYDPNELWEKTAGLLQSLLEEHREEEILGISVTSMAESVVPISADGQTLFPIIAWFDASARPQAEQLISTVGREEIFSICGLDPDPIFSLPKIMWVREHYPEVYEKASVWLQMSDYIYFCLTGECVTEYTLACRTLAFDLESRGWSKRMLSAAEVPSSVFPEVVKSGTRVGKVTQKASEQTGIAFGTDVYAGGHDHPCATLTTGCLNGLKIMDSSGTAEALLLISEKGKAIPHKPEGQRVGLYLDPDRYVLWGGIKASAASADWGYRHLTTTDDWTGAATPIEYEKILSAVSEVPYGSHGVIYIPHLRGSGAPFWNPLDRGAFTGLGSAHDDITLMHAIFEGLSCQARMIVEMHERISAQTCEALCTAGGSVRNLYWQQLKADQIGKPVELSPFEDATVHGAAMLAAVGAGIYKDVEEVCRAMAVNNRILYPDENKRQICDLVYERFLIATEAICRLSRDLDRYPV